MDFYELFSTFSLQAQYDKLTVQDLYITLMDPFPSYKEKVYKIVKRAWD